LSLDSPYDQAERYIAYGTGIYVIIIAWIIYLQVYWPTDTTHASSSGTSSTITVQTIGKLLPSDFLALASLTSVSFVVGYFFKYLGIHDLFDKLVFKFQREIRRYICNQLRNYFYEKFPDRGRCRQPDDHELMKVFYEFINK
jgi:hypothetical protein